MSRALWDLPDATTAHLMQPIDYFTAADADPLCDCGQPAVVETWNGPRCRNHGDVIEPDAFALEANATA